MWWLWILIPIVIINFLFWWFVIAMYSQSKKADGKADRQWNRILKELEASDEREGHNGIKD